MNMVHGSPAPAVRLHGLDAARGTALVAMALFHFNFDLELLGIKPSGYINQTHWVVFARMIAGSFLILVGIGLYLAHASTIRWSSFWKRFAKIVAAALIITVATRFATPDTFIFFGILHNIALASLLGLIFLRAPWFLTGIVALFFLLSRAHLQTPLLDSPFWWWTGLSKQIPVSSDYVPLFPWFGCTLLGIAIAKIAQGTGLLDRAAGLTFDGKLARLLRFFGRHSLVVYLVHQPILIGLLFAYLKLFSGTAID